MLRVVERGGLQVHRHRGRQGSPAAERGRRMVLGALRVVGWRACQQAYLGALRIELSRGGGRLDPGEGRGKSWSAAPT